MVGTFSTFPTDLICRAFPNSTRFSVFLYGVFLWTGWAPVQDGHLSTYRAKQGYLGCAGAWVPLQLCPSPSASPSKINIFDIKMVEMHPSPSATSIWHTNPQIGCIASLNYLQRIHQGIFSCLKHVFDVVTFIWCFTDPGVAVTAFLDLMF